MAVLMPSAAGCHAENDDWVLQLRVQTGAKVSEFRGAYGDQQKLAIQAIPVNGGANKAIQAFLASAFGVAKNQVSIEKGTLSQTKRVRIKSPRKIPPALQIK